MVHRINGDNHCLTLVFINGKSNLRGSDFWRVGHIAQQMFEITEQHEADAGAQIVPVFLAGTELGAAVLIPTVTQLQDLMDVKGQQVEDKKVV